MKKIRVAPSTVDQFLLYKLVDFVTFQDVLDAINKVKKPSSFAAIKGTAFNMLIDYLASGGTLKSKPNSVVGRPIYEWRHEGITFEFPSDIAISIAKSLEGALQQVYTSAMIETAYGEVELYGYVDYVLRDVAVDLKTTSQYEMGNYLRKFQYKSYLYTLNNSGNCIPEFRYLITDFKGIFTEDYVWSEKLRLETVSDLNSFFEFCQEHRSLISNENVLF